MPVLKRGTFLIPEDQFLNKWPVVACDQFTSQPDYWRRTALLVGDAPSAYHIILPEAELGGNDAERIAAIDRTMEEYLSREIFRRIPEAYILVERTLHDGTVRRGVICLLDLEQYDYREDARTPVRATERTVVSRIPPRVRIREDAALELSHVLLLCSDPTCALLENAERGEKLYELELMQGGGHLAGYLVGGAAAARFDAALAAYERGADGGFCYAVGDGNHSLAAAKSCWEALKAKDPSLAGTEHPARYATVELENLFDPAQRFEPIHRIVRNVEPEALLAALQKDCAPGGAPVEWHAAEKSGTLCFGPDTLPLAALQRALDAWLEAHGGEIDYIHGGDVAVALSRQERSIAFLMPPIDKNTLFDSIGKSGVLPRKTFSMGLAEEKRYYLECREIKSLQRTKE